MDLRTIDLNLLVVLQQLLFHLPRRFAEDLADRYDLVVREPLSGMEPRYDSIYLYWHERYNKDPMCAWVIEQLKVIHGLDSA